MCRKLRFRTKLYVTLFFTQQINLLRNKQNKHINPLEYKTLFFLPFGIFYI